MQVSFYWVLLSYMPSFSNYITSKNEVVWGWVIFQGKFLLNQQKSNLELLWTCACHAHDRSFEQRSSDGSFYLKFDYNHTKLAIGCKSGCISLNFLHVLIIIWSHYSWRINNFIKTSIFNYFQVTFVIKWSNVLLVVH